MRPNVAASIRGRLLNRARGEDTNFQFLLDRYACERFLYRLGQSDLRDRFILKGASLLAVWMDEPYRSTRDLTCLRSEKATRVRFEKWWSPYAESSVSRMA